MNKDPDQQQTARRAQDVRESRERDREVAEADRDRQVERTERAEAHRRRRECDDDICRTFIPEQRRPIERPRR